MCRRGPNCSGLLAKQLPGSHQFPVRFRSYFLSLQIFPPIRCPLLFYLFFIQADGLSSKQSPGIHLSSLRKPIWVKGILIITKLALEARPEFSSVPASLSSPLEFLMQNVRPVRVFNITALHCVQTPKPVQQPTIDHFLAQLYKLPQPTMTDFPCQAKPQVT